MAERLKITYRALSSLEPYAANARTHSPQQIAQVAASISEFGWTSPVLVDDQGGIIAGHAGVAAASIVGIDPVPVIVLRGLSETRKRALVLADNKLALNAGWDDTLLASELQALQADDFNLDLLGFSVDEIAALTDLGGNASEAGEGGRASHADFKYQEKFAVLVMCNDEAHQAGVFERLQALGYECKVLVN